MSRGPVPGSRTRRLEAQIAVRLRRGMTAPAIALALATTVGVVVYTRRRLRIRRPPGRPRADEPGLIPSVVPARSRW